MRLGDLAKLLDLPAVNKAGLESAEVFGFASLPDASPEELSFYGDPRYAAALKRTRALAVLVPESLEQEPDVPIIRCKDLAATVSKLVAHFTPEPIAYPPGIHPTAVVAPNATVHPEASVQAYAVLESGVSVGKRSVIGAHTYVGHSAQIGENCLLHPHVCIGERCLIGNRVILHSGVVIGSDGFGFEAREGKQIKIPQTGIVQIDDDVEIGANSTVDRARFGRTHIGEGSKLDNLVQIAHNVVVGPQSVLCAHVGVSGSTRLGAGVTLAGKVGVNGHIEIGEGVMVGAMSGVVRNVPAGQVVAGRPVMPMKQYKQNYVQTRNIHKLYARVAALEALLEQKKDS